MPRFLLSWIPALLWAGFIFYLSSQTWVDAPARFPINDKVAHVVLYGVFGLAVAWGGRRLEGARVHVGLILLAVLFAVSDEWHQSFVPMRDSSAGDLVADAVGIVLGYLPARAHFRSRAHRE
jgi:VanZ family protein